LAGKGLGNQFDQSRWSTSLHGVCVCVCVRASTRSAGFTHACHRDAGQVFALEVMLDTQPRPRPLLFDGMDSAQRVHVALDTISPASLTQSPPRTTASSSRTRGVYAVLLACLVCSPLFVYFRDCPLREHCPYRHVTGVKTAVCKHWMRGLCKKGDDCEYLHEYDRARMPPCHFFETYSTNTTTKCPPKSSLHRLYTPTHRNMLERGLRVSARGP
jgi:hypothetical protein